MKGTLDRFARSMVVAIRLSSYCRIISNQVMFSSNVCSTKAMHNNTQEVKRRGWLVLCLKSSVVLRRIASKSDLSRDCVYRTRVHLPHHCWAARHSRRPLHLSIFCHSAPEIVLDSHLLTVFKPRLKAILFDLTSGVHLHHFGQTGFLRSTKIQWI